MFGFTARIVSREWAWMCLVSFCIWGCSPNDADGVDTDADTETDNGTVDDTDLISPFDLFSCPQAEIRLEWVLEYAQLGEDIGQFTSNVWDIALQHANPCETTCVPVAPETACETSGTCVSAVGVTVEFDYSVSGVDPEADCMGEVRRIRRASISLEAPPGLTTWERISLHSEREVFSYPDDSSWSAYETLAWEGSLDEAYPPDLSITFKGSGFNTDSPPYSGEDLKWTHDNCSIEYSWADDNMVFEIADTEYRVEPYGKTDGGTGRFGFVNDECIGEVTDDLEIVEGCETMTEPGTPQRASRSYQMATTSAEQGAECTRNRPDGRNRGW